MKITTLDLGEDLLSVTLIGDSENGKTLGNFMGLYGTPQQGGYYWYAENGDNGYCDSEDEAQKEIKEARGR